MHSFSTTRLARRWLHAGAAHQSFVDLPRAATRPWCRLAVGAAAVVALACSGCSRQSDPLEKFAPPADLARAAVEALLDDWKAGCLPRPIDRLAVKVQVIDNQRKEGQRLDDFEILGEAPGEAARCFAVRLKLSRPESDEKVRYAVIGIDPLLVFRHEDLELLNHWDHLMPADELAAPDPENPDNDEK
ncbi:MAG TPA: hypothetical protein VKU82_05095 [Planctomycetaceae bacterium]|nr:hypothetical protein [Planctomycetaceae bacterium]